MYNELAINWQEPHINPETGQWWTKAENMTERTKTLLCIQPMTHLIIEGKREAKISFDRSWVLAYGVHRCWWFLREEVVEHPVMPSLEIEMAMDAALNTDNPYSDDGAGFGGDLMGFIS